MLLLSDEGGDFMEPYKRVVIKVSGEALGDEQGKGFHLKWTILTFIGIFGMVISVLLVKFNNFFSTNVLVYIADILNILYQFVLLIYWWVSEHFIKRRNTFSRK